MKVTEWGGGGHAKNALDWVGNGFRRPKQRQTRRDKVSGKVAMWENPAISAPKMRARLNNRAWWTDKVPIFSAFYQHAHTPFQYLVLHCAALQGQVAVLNWLRGWWPGWAFVTTRSEQRYGALCGPVCVFHPIGSLWLLPCVCEHGCVCRTKLPATTISALVVLWSVSASDSLYLSPGFSLFFIPSFIHIIFLAFTHLRDLFFSNQI